MTSTRRLAVGTCVVMAGLVVLSLGAGALTATFTEITPPSTPFDLNDAGQLVGPRFVQDVDGAYRHLPNPPGFNNSQAYGVNSHGDVVGFTEVMAAFYSDTAVLWPAGGAPVTLGMPPGDVESHAVDINDAGVIVGISKAEQPGPGWLSSWVRDPEDGIFVDLGTLPGAGDGQIEVTAINNAGVATGNVHMGISSIWLGFTWTEAGGMVAMPLPTDETAFWPLDINNVGQILGRGSSGTTYVWDPVGGFTELTMDGHDSAVGAALNDSGLVVGTVRDEYPDGIPGQEGEEDPITSITSPAAWDLSTGDATVFPYADHWSQAFVAVNNNGVALSTGHRTFLVEIGPDTVPSVPPPPAAVPAATDPTYTG